MGFSSGSFSAFRLKQSLQDNMIATAYRARQLIEELCSTSIKEVKNVCHDCQCRSVSYSAVACSFASSVHDCVFIKTLSRILVFIQNASYNVQTAEENGQRHNLEASLLSKLKSFSLLSTQIYCLVMYTIE